MEEIKTPTLEKIKAIQRESELFGKFLDWMLQRYTVFDRKQVRESPFADVMGAGDYINKERLLAEFFDIDLDAANKERELLYKNATLLYGPPGTGKTMFARYIAFKKALPFCYLNFSRIIDSYMGSTAKNIAKAFAYASSNPCIFMLDEVDTISCDRKSTSGKGSDGEMSRITVTLMQEFDKIPNDVIVLAATNRYDLLDSAFVSRFSIKQEMKPFTTEENQKMIQMFLSDIGYEFDETEINRIVKGTHDQREIMSKTIQLLAEKI